MSWVLKACIAGCGAYEFQYGTPWRRVFSRNALESLSGSSDAPSFLQAVAVSVGVIAHFVAVVSGSVEPHCSTQCGGLPLKV